MIPTVMTTLEILKSEIRKLSEKELSSFRAWFAEYDWQAWDRQLERDVSAGRLDALASEALEENERGETSEI